MIYPVDYREKENLKNYQDILIYGRKYELDDHYPY